MAEFRRSFRAAQLALLVFGGVATASAQESPVALDPAPHAAAPTENAPRSAAEHRAAAAEHRAAAAEHDAASAGHEAAAAEHGAAADEHGAHHHVPQFSDINWIYGFFGEKEGVEPSLLWRTPGMPVPFGATLINWGILIALIVALAKKQLPAALKRRKADIVRGMDDAAKMLEESALRLAEYEQKLAHVDDEIARVREDMRRAGEIERDRILAEASERRARLEREARRMIETELEAARDQLRAEVVAQALKIARASLTTASGAAEQQRLFDESIASLQKLPSKSLGGQS